MLQFGSRECIIKSVAHTLTNEILFFSDLQEINVQLSGPQTPLDTVQPTPVSYFPPKCHAPVDHSAACLLVLLHTCSSFRCLYTQLFLPFALMGTLILRFVCGNTEILTATGFTLEVHSLISWCFILFGVIWRRCLH